MIKENQRAFNTLLLLIDWLCLYAALLTAYFVRLYCFAPAWDLLPLRYYLLLSLLIVPLNTLILYCMGLYGARRNKPFRQELFLIFCGVAITVVILSTLLYIIMQSKFSRLCLALFAAFYFLMDGFIRFILRRTLRTLRKKGFNQKYLLLIGDGDLALRFVQKVEGSPQYGYRFYGCLSDRKDPVPGDFPIPIAGPIGTIANHLTSGHVDEVVVAVGLEEYSRMEFIIGQCEKFGIKINVIPAFYQYLPSNPRMDEFDGIPFMVLRKIPLSHPVRAAIKRIFDIVMSVICLVVASPIILGTFLILHSTSREVAIYRQERIGYQFKPFTMYKFRTMSKVEGELSTGWTQQKDPRRTRFGVFLRKFSIDELPQFVNVLKGEMSIVGPRPEIASFVEQFRETIPRYMVRHQVKPGITGWAQVNNLRGDTSIEERIRSDIYYIENWSLSWDIRIIFKTITKAFYNPFE